MAKAYEKFYLEQAGSGLAGFSGVRYQRGHGFFGRIFSGIIPTVLKFLGREALETGLNIASDIRSGKDLKTAALERVKEKGENLADRGIKRGREYLQTGKGYKRQRRANKKANKSRFSPRRVKSRKLVYS